MALNVPMQTVQQPIVQSLSDAVAKWTDINNAQQQGQLAKQQEARLQSQNARENKLGDLQFGQHQRKAHNEVMTEFKTVLQKKAQAAGIQPNTPEYQQLANATYATGFDKIMQNTGAPPYKIGTNIDLGAVDALITPAEAQANEMQLQTAKQDAILRNQMQLGQFNNEYKDRADQRDYEQQRQLKGYDYQHDDIVNNEKYQRDLELARIKQGDSPNGRKPLTEYQAAQLQEKHDKLESDASDALQGIKSTKDELLGLKDLQDKVATGSIIGSDIAVGVRKMLPEKWGHGEDLNALQKGYANASLKAIGALKAGGTTLGAMSEKEGQWVRDAQASLNSTGTVNKDILDKGIALLDEREKTINNTLGLHRQTLNRVLNGEQTNFNQQQAPKTPPPKPDNISQEDYDDYVKTYFGGK